MKNELIIGYITAAGAIATVITLIILIANQKGTQDQISALAKIAEMLISQRNLSKASLGNKLVPSLKISFIHRDSILLLCIHNTGCNVIVHNIKSSESGSSNQFVPKEGQFPKEILQGMNHSFQLNIIYREIIKEKMIIYMNIVIENPVEQYFLFPILLKEGEEPFEYPLNYYGTEYPQVYR